MHLFTTRKIGNVLPTLLGWHNTEKNTLRKWIQTINKLQFCITAHGDHLQLLRTSPQIHTWYISFSRREMILNPCMNSSNLRFRRSSQSFLAVSRVPVV